MDEHIDKYGYKKIGFYLVELLLHSNRSSKQNKEPELH